MSRVLLLQGNQAVVEGAIAAGVKFYGGYPITPSTEIAEQLAARLPQVGGKFMQTEDEIAGLGAAIGASMGGKKAMTATSGPGFSLKQEMLGLACISEIPVTIVDVQRVGPATGQPTSPSQGEVMMTRWGTHGDHWVIVVSPSSVPECFWLTIRAVNLAEKYRVPVIILMDEVIGHMREKIELPDNYSSIEVVTGFVLPASRKSIWLTVLRKTIWFRQWRITAAATAGMSPAWSTTKKASPKVRQPER